uniref:AP2/ERF transcription factor n=1 Tax=Camptotheca acuminata TaxID=16922 RepID=A0A7G8AU92_CAMAC|nr:AP2/ERF transcription factor [Camptotheca acuminata]
MSRCTDGLIDAIMGSTGITISNCHFTHHNEVMLFGASDSYSGDAIMQITVAFNHFGQGLTQRMPRCRWGFVHVVNNDYTHWLMYAIGGSSHPTIISQELKVREMEMTSVKAEVMNSGRRRLCMVEGDAPVTKCVMRRRRDPSAVALGCNIDQGKQQQLQLLPVDQPTTVKRSSRFRGVSRSGLSYVKFHDIVYPILKQLDMQRKGRYIDGLDDLKHIYGIKAPGMQHKGRKESKMETNLFCITNTSGAYDEEESAARAYDLAAIKYWGPTTFTNFPATDYEKEIEIMQNVTKEEYLASLRRRSSGFSRGVSKYRGVARHHHNGRWEARIGRVFGNKYLYLGTYSTQEEAAHAYDIAAIEYRGINAVTNFDLSTYIRWLKPGANTVSPDDPRPNIETLPVQISSNRVPIEEPELIFQTNSYPMRNFSIPQKEEVVERKLLVSPCNKSSSSPTALSLLLRSSMFRDLMEKNSNVIDEEIEGNDGTNQSQTGSEEEFGGIFYNGIGNNPFVLSSNGDMLPGMESQEENALSLYNPTGQSLWNGSLNMPSSIH